MSSNFKIPTTPINPKFDLGTLDDINENKPSNYDEVQFRKWYSNWANIAGIDPDPDNPLHKYDYRKAYIAGVEPTINPDDGLYHWPSEYKADDHPNRFVNGIDTKTGLAIRQYAPPVAANMPSEDPMNAIMDSIEAGPSQAPTEEYLATQKPRGVKQILKEMAIGTIPLYGPAYMASKAEERGMALNSAQYRQAVENDRYQRRMDSLKGYLETRMKKRAELDEMAHAANTIGMLAPGISPRLKERFLSKYIGADFGKWENVRVQIGDSPELISAIQNEVGEISLEGPDGEMHTLMPGAGIKVYPMASVDELRQQDNKKLQWQADRAMKWAFYNRNVANQPPEYKPTDLDYAEADRYWTESKATDTDSNIELKIKGMEKILGRKLNNRELLQALNLTNAEDYEEPELPIDSSSKSIMAQTGLDYPTFMMLTGRGSQLARDQQSRKRAMKKATSWANKRGVDVSTFASQYDAYNSVLSANISRMNNTKIMEDELRGTIENLQEVVRDSDLQRLRFANVVKIWANQEVNDPLAQQYAMHLYQLRNELAAYGGATQGRSGNNLTLYDYKEAEKTIRAGIASGSLKGLYRAVGNSTGKMEEVMKRSVDTARKQVWELFGVGTNYQPLYPESSRSNGKKYFGTGSNKVIRFDANGNIIKEQ